MWAVDDCATIINSYDNKPSPPTDQFAERQGRQVAENIIKEEIVSVLGPSSFFGERALIDNQPHKTAVRARTSLDVVVMGRNAFTQISKSLSPLRNALAEALNRRMVDIWQDWPQAYEILRQTPLTEFIEPAPEPMLKPTITLREVNKVFSEYSNEFFYVASDGVHLEGIVTFTDLTRAFSSGAKMETPLAEFMIKEPIAVSIKDTSLVAVSTLRDYRLKSIPLVDERQGGRIAGYISARKMMAYVLRALDKQ